MNSLMKFALLPEGDTRCKICKHHQFLVLSQEAGIVAMHSHITKAIANRDRFPQIYREQGIHWWGDGIQFDAPVCLKSYQKIGGI